jgi:hypothetical protein
MLRGLLRRGIGVLAFAFAACTAPNPYYLAPDAGRAIVVGDYRLSFLVLGGHLACALEAPGGVPVVVEAGDTAFADGAAGVRAIRLSAAFRGLMVAR